MSVHAKQLGQEARAVKSVVKSAVFDSSSEEEEISRSATVSSSGSSSRWAAAASRPDLSDNYTSQDSGRNWDVTTPRPDLSDDWSAPDPRPDLNSCDLTTSNTPVPATDIFDESLITFINYGHTETPNETINFMSPIPKTKDTHPQWTPDA